MLDVAIIGAGFSGLGTAIRLREQGISDIAILERGDDVGGTWRDNTYPGAACDIPSNLYSFSFAQNPNWSRGYSGSAEILDYIHHLVDCFELRALMRFRHTVTGMTFDEARGVWTINVAGKKNVYARCVVSAQGPLANPALPNIPGIDTFGGKTIHSALGPRLRFRRQTRRRNRLRGECDPDRTGTGRAGGFPKSLSAHAGLDSAPAGLRRARLEQNTLRKAARQPDRVSKRLVLCA